MWVHIGFGVFCAALAAVLGWRCLRGSLQTPLWWVSYAIGVAALTCLVGVHVEGPQSPAMIWFTAAALVLAGVDALLLRLPNVLVYPTVVVVGTWLPVAAFLTGRPEVTLRVMAAGVFGGLCYLVLHLLSPSGMGMGDVKFAPAIAMVMGWDSWAWVLISVLVAFSLAAVWGMGLLLWRRGTRELPFGPFMVAGAAVTPVIAEPVLRWWL